jgi:hypothetical protein
MAASFQAPHINVSSSINLGLGNANVQSGNVASNQIIFEED